MVLILVRAPILSTPSIFSDGIEARDPLQVHQAVGLLHPELHHRQQVRAAGQQTRASVLERAERPPRPPTRETRGRSTRVACSQSGGSRHRGHSGALLFQGIQDRLRRHRGSPHPDTGGVEDGAGNHHCAPARHLTDTATPIGQPFVGRAALVDLLEEQASRSRACRVRAESCSR